MMSLTTAVICLCAVYLLTATEAKLTLIKTDDVNNGVSNVLFYNERIYLVDGLCYVYIYNTNLTQLHEFKICDFITFNAILLINEHADELIICGTGNEGRCQLRALSDIEKIKSISPNTVVSDEYGLPAVGFVTPGGNLMLGVTCGNDLYYGADSNVYFPITNRDVNFSVFRDIKQQISLPSNQSLPKYLIYFKDAFQINGFSYLVTNQKRYFRDVDYVSKLVRICQNDTSKYFNSYADVELSCMNGKISYNLIQYALVVNTSRDGHIFIAAFTQGTYPEDPYGDSVICYTKMDQLDTAIMQAKKDFVTCKSQISEDQRYFRSFRQSCLSEAEYQKEDVICSTSKPSFKYVIGVVPVKLTLGIRLLSSKGYITTLSSRTVGGDLIYILAGTSRGSLIKMNYLGLNNPLDTYEEQRIGNSQNSTVFIHSEGRDLYIVTSDRVYKYKETDCSEYTTCADTMTGRNPLCGWCVYKNRSTWMTECSNGTNYWLTSTGKCIDVEAQPKGQIIYPRHLRVLLNVTNLPVNSDYTTHFCKYKMKNGYINNDTQFFANNEGIGQFTCYTPNVTVHTEATLEFWTASTPGDDKDILLAETPFLFYNCSRYLTCRACTNTPYTDCHWCGASLTCQSPSSSCDGQPKQTYGACPQLLSNPVYFIPSGIEKTVMLTAKHLDVSSGIKYTCTLQSQNMEDDELVNDALDWNKTSVLCNINIEADNTISKVDYQLDIKYGKHRDNMLVLGDKCNKTVTVYRCENLAKYCRQCGALNSTRYQCGWCNDSCGYNAGLCNQTCPRPVITKIVPQDGPRQGGTQVRLYGTDIGETLSDIKSVHIGHTNCTDVSVTLGNDYKDFIQPVIHSISCKTGPIIANSTLLGRKGPIRIQVGSQIGEATSMFTYQEMSIASISPTYGIVSGGTRVTIYGQHLGIGNREILVWFGSWWGNAQVYPSLPLNVTSKNVNFTVQFNTPILDGNVTTELAIFIKQPLLIFAMALIGYTAVSDPVIIQIAPKQAFFSGGTIITIKGKNLTNAHEATLFVDDDADKLNEKCFLKTSTKAVCKVPIYREYLQNKNYTEHENIFVTVAIVIALDGIKTPFELQYNLDPVFETINSSSDSAYTNVLVIKPGEHLTIKGKYFDSIPKVTDISVTIGIDDCVITDKTDTKMTCIPPDIQPQPVIPGALYPEIKVSVGNINVTVGYVKYDDQVAIQATTSFTIIGVTVGISLGVVGIGVIIVTVVFTTNRFKKFKTDTANQQLQMNRMENRLQEAHAQLEVVENEVNDGQYADIDDIAINCPYEETGTYNTIADHGYQEQDNVSTTSSYFEFLQENEREEVQNNREVDNHSSSSNYQKLLPPSERVEVHYRRDSDNESSSSSYQEVLAASDKVVVTTSDYMTVLPERVQPASERIEVHYNRESNNEPSSSSYQEVMAASDRVEVHYNQESDKVSSSSSYADFLSASDKIVVTTSDYLTVLPERVLPASERVEVPYNRESDNKSSSSSSQKVLPASDRVVITTSD